MSVVLKAGGNYVVYTGKAQSVANAFASIMSYLDPTYSVYYWNNNADSYESVYLSSLMVPYGVYYFKVTQDCTWTYGAEETAPTSVQLYARGNLVPYCGKAIPPADALASILSYLDTGHWLGYFNNATKEWDIAATYMSGTWYFYGTMVPNGVYAIQPAQACVWSFVGPRTSITMVDAPSSAKPGDTVHVNFNIQSLWSGGSIYVGGELNFGNTPPYRSYSIPEYALLAYGAIQYFQFPSFTMPDVPILYLQLESYYWDGANWILDAGKQIQITRQGVTTPQLSEFKIKDFSKV